MWLVVTQRRQWCLNLLRVVLSFGMLFFLFGKITTTEMATVLDHSVRQWPLLLAAFMLPGVGLVIAGLRWQVLLTAHGGSTFIGKIIAVLLVSSFFNQFLPSTIGGDLVRGRWMAKSSGSMVLSLTVVGVDRALGVLGICAVALLAGIAGAPIVDQVPGFWMILTTVSLATAATLVLGSSVAGSGSALSRIVPVQFFGGLQHKTQIIYEALLVYRRQKYRLFLALLLSMGLQIAVIIQYFVLALAFGLHISIWELGVVVSIVTLISLIPITVNGIGLRESALVVLGAPLGVSANDAIALGGFLTVTLLVYAVIGGVVYMGGKKTPKLIKGEV